jgi:hypothetical protein
MRSCPFKQLSELPSEYRVCCLPALANQVSENSKDEFYRGNEYVYC